MSAIATTSDGKYVYLALEDTDGNQKIVRAARTNLSSWESAYDPGGGTAANVINVGAFMVFYGHFGTNKQIVFHLPGINFNVDNVAPPSLGEKVVNTCEMVSVNHGEAFWGVCTVNGDQDLYITRDLFGDGWAVADDALGFDPTALYVLWSGLYYPHRYFVAGNDGADSILLYSPNEGASSQDFAGSGLAAVANIAGVEVGGS